MTDALITLDPGENAGVALFLSGLLQWCGLGDALGYDVAGFIAEHKPRLVVEVPRIYPGSREIDPNRIVTLARTAERWICSFRAAGVHRIREVFPRDWKGTIDGEIFCRRILKRLTPDELARVPPEKPRRQGGLPKSLRHNAIDAVGLGLHELGRL
jgi:hypothetical protein